MVAIQTLPSSFCISSSIPILNSNFNNIKTKLDDLALSATQLFQPAIDVFNANKDLYNTSFEFLKSTSAATEEAATIVHALSGHWLKPITLIYKDILPQTANQGSVVNTVRDWLNRNFPQKSGSCINYINGQKFYIYSLKYAEITNSGVKTRKIKGRNVTRTYTVRVIQSRISRRVSFHCPGRKVQFRYTWTDKFVNSVYGYEFCMLNGTWTFIKELNISDPV